MDPSSTSRPSHAQRSSVLIKPPPNVRSKSKHKAVKKSKVARVASTLRRRRSLIRNRYEKAIIQLLERHDRLPRQGQDGLLYRVEQLPIGHSRTSLIEGFDAVVEVMSSNDSSTSITISAKSSNSSDRSKTGVAHTSVDLLSDDVFAPDDFDRYLGSDCLKPTPAPITNSHIQIQTSHTRGSAEGVLIQLDIESLPLAPLRTPTPSLSNSRPTSVDELFFDNHVRLSIRSLISPPSSPPAAADEFPTKDNLTSPEASSSRGLPQNEGLFQDPIRLDVRRPLKTSPGSPFSLAQHHVSLLDDPWPTPLIFRGSSYPVMQETEIRIQQEPSQDPDSPESERRALARKRGGKDLRVQASITRTVTSLGPKMSPEAGVQTVSATPSSLQFGPRTPHRPIPLQQRPFKDAIPSKWKDNTSSTVSSSPYQAYDPRLVTDVPTLPPISPVTFSLIDEMSAELAKVMDDWSEERMPELDTKAISSPPNERRISFLDMPIEEDITIPTMSSLDLKQPRNAASLDSCAVLFDNVAELLAAPATVAHTITDKPKKSPLLMSVDVKSISSADQDNSSDLLRDLLTELEALNSSKPTLTIPLVSKRRRSRSGCSNMSTSANESASTSPVGKPLPPLPVLSRPLRIPPRSSSKNAETTPNSPKEQKSSLTSTPAMVSGPSTTSLPSATEGTPARPAPSFRERMTKATVDALLDAENETDFARAWSKIKKTKRESRNLQNSDFEWQRWVDRDYEDEARASDRERSRKRRSNKRRRLEAQRATVNEESSRDGATIGSLAQGVADPQSPSKDERRRSNLFEALQEEFD